ncbi:MAG: outer membrane protein assembly factor BamA [Flavobacteriales bacterium]|nr:outer membrane protein assembly factor BamA [Flavobacteriales bacterium]
MHTTVFSQIDKNKLVGYDYTHPKEYIIGGISSEGSQSYSTQILAHISGLLSVEKIKIPGDEMSKAVEKLWAQQIYSNVELQIRKVVADTIYLHILVQERPRLSKYSIRGLGKTETKNVRDEISLRKGQIITENLVEKTRSEVEKYFFDKGFYNAKIDISRIADTGSTNLQYLRIDIKKGRKVKVREVLFVGNDSVGAKKLKRVIKPKQTKGKINPFASSKLVKKDYNIEKKNIIDVYQSKGYRDAKLVKDSIYAVRPNKVNIKITVDEGKKYYFRNISWTGNTKYTTGRLDSILGIEKGEIFNQSKLETRLFMNPVGVDVSSKYMDDGYLFFNIVPVETRVENDSIDLEIRIYEGKQAVINEVRIIGNTKTSDFVIRRNLRTLPGAKFSRSDIQRSMRELANLPYFNQETLDVNPIPNPANGTVDLEYKVEERSSDQVEASGGFGGGFGIVGTIGLKLNNFSTRKMFKGQFDPIPTGDGQQLTLRAQANGLPFQSYNFSFTEPWFGGKKPNSLTLSAYYSRQTYQNNYLVKNDPSQQRLHTTGISVLYGKLLKWPDDFFTLSNSLNYQKYKLENWSNYGAAEIGFKNGISNSLSWNTILARNSSSDMFFPRSGSEFVLSVQATLPHTAINNLFGDDRDFSTLPFSERYKWIEYNKWKFNATWYLGTFSKFVLVPHFETGIIGIYNKKVGYSPFEQFKVGGSGFGNWTVYGTEIIPQKGYDNGRVSDPINGQDADPLYSKFSLELRYPAATSPAAMLLPYVYYEGGNTWNHVREYNPFNMYNAAGAGMRLFVGALGKMQVDYGYGFNTNRWQLNFSIGTWF